MAKHKIKTRMTNFISRQRQNYSRATLFVALFACIGVAALIGSFAATSSVISGTVWQDTNRNGVVDAGEAPFANKEIYVLDNTTNTYVNRAVTDAAGHYQVGDLPDGQYNVQMSAPSWWDVRADWAPTTGNSLKYYAKIVTLAGSATADMGLRQIVKSTDAAAPISSFKAPSGLTVNSYVDDVTAQEVYTTLAGGGLMGGAESPYVTVSFALGGGSSTATGVGTSSTGVYQNYTGNSAVSYLSWLDGGSHTLFHEYGHAWSGYYRYILQQDPAMTEYQKIRGIYGDSRVNSTYGWQIQEIVAEDYRQLFGDAQAMAGDSQINTDIPLAKDVPGLKDYLAGVFIKSDTSIPTAPQNLSGLGLSQSQIKLTWTASTDNLGVTGYDIYRNDTKVATVGGSALSYTDSFLNSAATYNYYIKARDGSGNTSPASATVSVNTLAPPPAAPTGLQAVNVKDTTAGLTWTASAGSTSTTDYDIYRNNQKVATVNSPSVSFSDTGLSANTSYSYVVKARDAAGVSSDPSNVVTIKTLAPDAIAPTKPANLKLLSSTGTSVTLAWTASTDNVGVTGYRIYKVGTAVPLKTATATSDTVSNLTKNTQYSFYVTAVDQAGNESAPSNTIKVRTPSR